MEQSLTEPVVHQVATVDECIQTKGKVLPLDSQSMLLYIVYKLEKEK